MCEGAGENNLAFKLKRKRLVVETLHLGVEGGVGERRTEPAPSSGIELGNGVGTRATRTVKTESVPTAPIPASESSNNPVRTESSVKSAMAPADRADAPVVSKPKVRARVRFGGEEHAAPSVEVSKDLHNHSHAGHDHAHPPANSSTGHSTVRHDRMDLYEF